MEDKKGLLGENFELLDDVPIIPVVGERAHEYVRWQVCCFEALCELLLCRLW